MFAVLLRSCAAVTIRSAEQDGGGKAPSTADLPASSFCRIKSYDTVGAPLQTAGPPSLRWDWCRYGLYSLAACYAGLVVADIRDPSAVRQFPRSASTLVSVAYRELASQHLVLREGRPRARHCMFPCVRLIVTATKDVLHEFERAALAETSYQVSPNA